MTRHFATADDLRAEVNDARVWAGVHYRFSVQAGSALGREVADYDLSHGFCTRRLERPASGRAHRRAPRPLRELAHIVVLGFLRRLSKYALLWTSESGS